MRHQHQAVCRHAAPAGRARHGPGHARAAGWRHQQAGLRCHQQAGLWRWRQRRRTRTARQQEGGDSGRTVHTSARPGVGVLQCGGCSALLRGRDLGGRDDVGAVCARGAHRDAGRRSGCACGAGILWLRRSGRCGVRPQQAHEHGHAVQRPGALSRGGGRRRHLHPVRWARAPEQQPSGAAGPSRRRRRCRSCRCQQRPHHSAPPFC
mmetsp:Transcript_37796/g.111865  ORF Transcript_37796/g.111865 Transcript_37796/m.111865 type:complete len:207 (+) Transcript_37796:1852-2472(+)